MAKSYISREMIRLGGQPELRQNFITDNGNLILDVHNLTIIDPPQLEKQINNIAGVVSNGIFAIKPADMILIGQSGGVNILKNQ
jgi:ribose 5-phosphate isomerase A